MTVQYQGSNPKKTSKTAQIANATVNARPRPFTFKVELHAGHFIDCGNDVPKARKNPMRVSHFGQCIEEAVRVGDGCPVVMRIVAVSRRARQRRRTLDQAVERGMTHSILISPQPTMSAGAHWTDP
jgi:hypothetical protein